MRCLEKFFQILFVPHSERKVICVNKQIQKEKNAKTNRRRKSGINEIGEWLDGDGVLKLEFLEEGEEGATNKDLVQTKINK